MQHPKILIVEDQITHQEVIMGILEEYGYECNVLSAYNGKTGLEIAIREAPDIIISDWEMPVMDGISFIKQLKENSETTDIPVIMCTGIMTSSENLETALNAGAVDYIRKPIDKLELIARVKANLHLVEKHNEVKKLNEIKDQILSVISHDLRGPVASIINITDLAVRNRSEFNHEQFINLFHIISKQSALTFNILENLLLWAKSQRNGITMQAKWQVINNAIIDNLSLLAERAKQKDIVITNNVSPKLHAHFDANLISTVVRNLLSNAIKFTPANGKITISATSNNDFVFITVLDSGIGINKDRVCKVFDKNVYETTYGTNYEKGSGLGLKLCREFIEMHGGKIWVESKVGKGSKFKFSLPLNGKNYTHL